MQFFLKRLLDLIVSFVGIIILTPFFIIIAFFILSDFSGGVFYLQKRVGRNNRDFMLIKFRTMKKGSDKKGLLTVGKDSRITPAGRFLRKYKLDELPQLFNVFIGTMSLVGPRPEVRKYVEMYSEEQQKILRVKPGLTDYASLEYFDENTLLGKSEDPENTYIREVIPAKLKLNEKYLVNVSLRHDLKILWLTFLKIIGQ
jgi:lipopolysaccharide/colanic/teichoic acid biosynthesis glycosyltransferase